MSDHILPDAGARQDEILNRVLYMQKYLMLALVVIGGISAFPALPYLFRNPDYPLYDSILQLANGVILLGAAIALFVLPVSQTRRVALIILALVMADLTIRVILTHHMPYALTTISREDVMVQFSPMIPAILVACFLFLESRQALLLTWSLTLITACSVLIYQIKGGAEAWNHFGRLGVVLQFLFAHPVIIILLTMISRVHRTLQDYSEYLVTRHSYIEDKLLRDETGLLLTRPAFYQLLKSRLNNRQYAGRLLLIRIVPSRPRDEQPIAELRMALARVLQSVLHETTGYGLLESDLIMASCSRDTDFAAEDAAIHKAWDQLENHASLALHTMTLKPGVTWPILLDELESNLYRG